MQVTGTPTDQDDWLIEDEPSKPAITAGLAPWKILIVDDEPDVHTVTKVAIRGIQYKGRGLEILSAYSGAEGYEKIVANPDIALILLDVVMERSDAGLALVQRIRGDLGNHTIRVVLRTGQPGEAPEQEVILGYDINDYKEKTELSAKKLYTTVIASLRAYESLVTIERSRQGLNQILDGCADLYQRDTLKEFASGVLNQIGAVLNIGIEGILCAADLSGSDGNIDVLAVTGMFSHIHSAELLDKAPKVHELIHEALLKKQCLFDHPHEALYFPTKTHWQFAIYFQSPWPLNEIEIELMRVFCDRISAAFDNLYFHTQMQNAQEATVIALADLAEFRDSDTGEHILRVKRLSQATAERMLSKGLYPEKLTAQFVKLIGIASILHDVGKVGTPDSILFKPAMLSEDERAIMNRHTVIGGAILDRAARMVEGQSYLSLAAEIAGSHHEKFNGSGYPKGLQGDDIPLAGRIVSVVDVFDALVHRRIYKEPWSKEDALRYLKENAGSQFDPLVVETFIELI